MLKISHLKHLLLFKTSAHEICEKFGYKTFVLANTSTKICLDSLSNLSFKSKNSNVSVATSTVN